MRVFGLSAGAGKGLLDKDVLAVFQSFLSKVKMGVDWSDDANGIDICGLQNVVGVPGDIHVRVALTSAPHGIRALVADPHDPRTLLRMEIPDDIRAPVTVPDHSHADDILIDAVVEFEDWGSIEA